MPALSLRQMQTAERCSSEHSSRGPPLFAQPPGFVRWCRNYLEAASIGVVKTSDGVTQDKKGQASSNLKLSEARA